MEIISFNATLAFYAVATLALSVLLGTAFRWIHGKIKSLPDLLEGGVIRQLSDPAVRSELTAFLSKQGVVGDADIRAGLVHAPVPPERLDPLAVVLGNAASMLTRLQNPAGCSIYVRDSENDRFMLLGDLDLDVIHEAARVMSRVAEDRRKSRSLYKGMTDEEILGFTRAGLSQAFKAQGNFETANIVMSGGWDKHPEFQRASAVLGLLFRVKGARND